jgi:hypothetical protein
MRNQGIPKLARIVTKDDFRHFSQISEGVPCLSVFDPIVFPVKERRP